MGEHEREATGLSLQNILPHWFIRSYPYGLFLVAV